MIVLTVVIAVILISISIMLYGRKDNKQIPYIYSGTKIFLTKDDIAKFENSTREEKRRAMGHWKSAIKRGHIIPIFKGGAIVGYVKNKRK